MHKPGLFWQSIQATRQRSHRSDCRSSLGQSQLSSTWANNKMSWTPASTLLSGVFPHFQEYGTGISALDLQRAGLGKARLTSSESTVIQRLCFLRIQPVSALDLKGLNKWGLSRTIYPSPNSRLYSGHTCPSLWHTPLPSLSHKISKAWTAFLQAKKENLKSWPSFSAMWAFSSHSQHLKSGHKSVPFYACRWLFHLSTDGNLKSRQVAFMHNSKTSIWQNLIQAEMQSSKERQKAVIVAKILY